MWQVEAYMWVQCHNTQDTFWNELFLVHLYEQQYYSEIHIIPFTFQVQCHTLCDIPVLYAFHLWLEGVTYIVTYIAVLTYDNRCAVFLSVECGSRFICCIMLSIMSNGIRGCLGMHGFSLELLLFHFMVVLFTYHFIHFCHSYWRGFVLLHLLCVGLNFAIINLAWLFSICHMHEYNICMNTIYAWI